MQMYQQVAFCVLDGRIAKNNKCGKLQYQQKAAFQIYGKKHQ